MAPHSSTLAWKIPWAEEPGRLHSMGLLRVRHHWASSLSLFTFMHWRRKWQPTPVFLPGESHGRGASWAAIYGVAQSRTWLSDSTELNWTSMGSSLPMNWAHVSYIGRWILCHWATWEALIYPLKVEVKSCPTLRDPMDCSLPGSSAHGIFQARVLEWLAISFSRGSSQPMDQTQVSHIVGRCFTVWATREVLKSTHYSVPIFKTFKI